MEVRKVNPDCRSDVKKFINFPFKLYRTSDYWVPWMRSDAQSVFIRRKHPFYRHSVAAFFIVESGKETLGRIAVINHRLYNEFHGTKTAFFYFFDVVENMAAARLLFEAASAWARQQGLEQITGPLGFHALDGRGILVEGFDSLPATGIPYNYPYYGPFLEKMGLEKKSDFLSGLIGYQDFPERFYKVRQRGENHFWVKSFSDKKELLGWAETLRLIYNKTFPVLSDHYPMPKEEMDFTVKRLIDIADPRLIKMMMKDKEPVGFILVYPNIVRGIKRANGQLWPFGWFHLLRELKSTRRVDFNGVAILPEYRGRGGNAVLYAALKESLEEFGFEEGEIVQIEEDNDKSLGEAGLIKVKWCKRHRIYIKDL